MKLYHPSNELFKTVKVKYFGQHNYTLSDLKASKVPRTFWYFKIIAPERRLENCEYSYMININKDKIYNLKKDKNNLKIRFENIHQLLLHLKKKYLGVLYRPDGYDLVCIFYDMKPLRIINNRITK